MHRLQLTAPDIEAIQRLLDGLTERYTSVEDAAFLRSVGLYAQELPQTVRRCLLEFKLCESASVCVIAGFPIDDARLGATPTHWYGRAAAVTTRREEMLCMLYGSLLGEVFGWSTQQNGAIIHNVLPIKSQEHSQGSGGSADTLLWHTEDAFHPYKGDYVGLLCLRNYEQAATTFASIDAVTLDPAHRRVLAEPHYIIRPDESHLEHSLPDGATPPEQAELRRAAYARISEMQRCPRPEPVLFGNLSAPYLCLDPYYMELADDDELAAAALEALIHALDMNLTEVVLQPGDCCFIDNFKAVHGRKAFKARYDGRDRWLKRINVTRDLRKSRSARLGTDSRIIF